MDRAQGHQDRCRIPPGQRRAHLARVVTRTGVQRAHALMKRYGLSYEHLMPALARSAAFALVATAALLALALLPGSVFFGAPAAFAQADEDEVDTTNRERLAKEFSDPLTTLPQIFVQDAYTPPTVRTRRPTGWSFAPSSHASRDSACCHSSNSSDPVSSSSPSRPVRAAPRAPSLAICNCSMP